MFVRALKILKLAWYLSPGAIIARKLYKKEDCCPECGEFEAACCKFLDCY